MQCSKVKGQTADWQWTQVEGQAVNRAVDRQQISSGQAVDRHCGHTMDRQRTDKAQTLDRHWTDTGQALNDAVLVEPSSHCCNLASF